MQIATVLNDKIKKDNLNDIGNLEQDFVYGEATSKELLSMINSKHVHQCPCTPTCQYIVVLDSKSSE